MWCFQGAGASEPFTGPFERLPALLPVAPVSSVEAEVHAVVATMQNAPNADPYWLAVWTETAPFSESAGLRARLPGSVQILPTGPVLPGERSAVSDTRGRYLVAVRVLQKQEPVLAIFAFAAGIPTDPGVQIRRATIDQLNLTWTDSVLYPFDRPLFQRSKDLQNWYAVPPLATARTLNPSYGFEWRISHRPAPNLFIRLKAELVP